MLLYNKFNTGIQIMTKPIKVFLILFVFTFTVLHAKNGYDYYHYGNGGSSYTKLNKTSILKIAKAEVRRLTMKGKIPHSWKSIPVSKIHKSNTDDWMVIFNNTKIKDRSKQKLYIFIGIYGKVKGVNYTGH